MDIALDAEGASPQDAAVARSIYQQESGSGKNTKTSNADAHGGMQIIPATFHSVADKGWDINDPVDNARAGVRYIKQLSEKAGGDPALTAAGYYGGPGAIDKAQKGIAVSDPRNPNAPTTLQYGQQVAGRIEKGNWWDNFPLADASSGASTAPQQAPQDAGNAQVASGAVQAQGAPSGQPTQAASAPANPDPNGYGAPPPSDNIQFALPGQKSPAQIAAEQAAQQPQKGWFQRAADEATDSPIEALGNAAHGVVDGLTFGMADKAGAALNAAVNYQDGGSFSDRYHNVLGQVQDYEDKSPAFLTGQIGSAFVPGAGDISLVNKAIEAVPTASRAARVMAGGAAGMTEGAAQVLGHANYLDDVTPGQLATGMGLGAVGGGLGGAFTKATDNQLSNSFLLKAGSVEGGQRDAQILSDLQAMNSRATQEGAKLGPADANALARRYTQEAADQLRQMPKTEDRQTLLNALNRARGLSDDQISALRQLPNGDAVADAIQMHQRTLTLTSPTPANLGKVASLARMLVDNGALHAVSHVVPGGSLLTLAPVRHYVMGALLGGRTNRTANIESALQQGPMAQAFLKRFGQGTAGQSAQDLAQAAQAAQAARAAAATAGQTAKGWKQGDSAFERAQAAAQQARQQAQAASPFTPEAQAAARDYMFRAQQSGQANRAGMAQQSQQAAQAEASVGPQMNATQAKAAQAYAKQQAEQLAAQIGPQVTPAQRAALQAQEAANAAASKESLKTQLAQKQALADQFHSDPTNLLGMSNQFGPPRNADQMSEFSKVMRSQAEAAAMGPHAPASPALQAAQKAQAKAEVATPGNVAVWRNSDTDIPVTVKHVEPQPGPDGRTYVRVDHNGQETFVPADELQPATKAAQAHVKAQAAERRLTSVMDGSFNAPGLDTGHGRLTELMSHVGTPEGPISNATGLPTLQRIANDHPTLAPKITQLMTSGAKEIDRASFYEIQRLLKAEHGDRTPQALAERDARRAAQAAPAGPSPIAQATGDIQSVPAWNSAKESRQIIQKQALAQAQDPEVQKLVAKLIDTKNVKTAKDPNEARQKAFDDFMKGASTDQQIEAKRVAETLIRYGK
jgi:hypothetical protein